MENIINKITGSNNNISMTILRIIVGIIFIAHGSQKLFGLFGGYGLEGTGQFMVSIGLQPGYLMALLAGLGEFVGGLLVLVGLFTRLGSLLLIAVSLVAMFVVHIHNGFFMSGNGFEYILTLLTVSIVLLIEGSGKYSIDNIINKMTK